MLKEMVSQLNRHIPTQLFKEPVPSKGVYTKQMDILPLIQLKKP